MQKSELNKAYEYGKAYKRKKLRQRIVAGLAAVVVFITTYALILPAITQERPAFCGLAEHSHTQACLESGCSLIQHIHSEECYIQPLEDKEDKRKWESTLPKDLSGVWAEDIVAIAQSQLGYKESANNLSTADQATSDSAACGNYTRYGDWYSTPYAEWKNLFVNFCLHYAGVDENYFPYYADSAQWARELQEKELIKNIPSAGDVVFFRNGVGVDDGKTAIVEKLIYDNDKLIRIRTIQGDIDGKVDYLEYSVNDEVIFGYGDITSAYNKYYCETPQEKVFSNDSVTVTATYLPSAGIPKDAVLEVEIITSENPLFEEHYNQALDKLDSLNGDIKTAEITGFRLYDIHFIHNGQEIQPQDKVDVSVSYPITAYSQTASVSVLHYLENGTEVAESTHKVDGEGNLVADFETESFSLFAIVTSETFINNIISLEKHSVTSVSQSNLSGTYAIVSGNYALGVKGTELTVMRIEYRDSVITADESLACWKFSSAGSGYDIYTTIDGKDYYLTTNGDSFELSDVPSAFTVNRSDTAITVGVGSSYLNINENGASWGSSAALSLYKVPTGSFTVVFDGQIGKAQYMGSSNYKYSDAERVTLTTDSNGYIKLPTPEETKVPGNYPLRLNGWYDIINSVYYDSSMFGVTIRVTGNTTFYPEWIAETYDIGQNKNVVAEQPDTSGFIETRVFDYNELFNVHSSYYNESDNKWYFDPDSELGFIFFDYINPSGNIGNIADKGQAVDGITVNTEKTNGTRGSSTNFPGTITPGIATEERINALFGDTPIMGRIALGEGDWLYQYDAESGFYYYNSAANAASYNQKEQRFYVYNHIVTIDSQNSLHDFLPFNYADADTGDTEFAEKDNEANYWFGMSSEITFYLPNDSGGGGNQSANGEDMQFRFSGDDDVWVFVDGELVLDLGGVHDVVYGEINFSTGEVKTGQAISSSNIADNSAATHEEMPGLTGTSGITTTKLKTLEGGKEHKLTVYYLERGSSLSNCAVYFNLSPLYQLALTKEDSTGKNLLAGATFQAFADEECTIPAILYEYDENGALQELPEAKFTTNENGLATCWGLFAGRTYYIKEIESPPGYSDMSKYVIEFTLSDDGKSVFIMIDTNGTQWEFAGEYVYGGGEEHLIKLHVYNEEYIGGDGKLYVEKQWAEGSENIPESITLWLYANGEKTNRSIVLSAENGWKASFLELPETDENGNEIVYTVAEEKITGYNPTYTPTQGSEEIETTVPGYWTHVTSLTNGKTYRFINDDGMALAISGTNLTLVEPDDDDDNQKWVVSGSGSSFTFKNVGTGRYLYLSRNSASTSTNSRNITYSNNRFTYSSRYLYHNGSSFSMSQRSYTAFRAYEWTPPTTSTETIYYEGFTVLNTPWEDEIKIPVEVKWDETVSESDIPDEVEVKLYEVTIGSDEPPVLVETITVSKDENWTDSFSPVPYPEEGKHYVVVQGDEDFSTTYEGENVEIPIDGTDTTGEKVGITEDGDPVTVVIVNSLYILLPDTGGEGIVLWIIGGISAAALAVALYIINSKKRKFRI